MNQLAHSAFLVCAVPQPPTPKTERKRGKCRTGRGGRTFRCVIPPSHLPTRNFSGPMPSESIRPSCAADAFGISSRLIQVSFERHVRKITRGGVRPQSHGWWSQRGSLPRSNRTPRFLSTRESLASVLAVFLLVRACRFSARVLTLLARPTRKDVRMDVLFRWWSQRGSNPRPQACKARALPTEL